MEEEEEEEKQTGGKSSASTKRSRAAAIHNQSERVIHSLVQPFITLIYLFILRKKKYCYSSTIVFHSNVFFVYERNFKVNVH